MPDASDQSPEALFVFEAVRKAQGILVDHIKPGGPPGEETVNELLGVKTERKVEPLR
jgi:hypothetical protein